VPRVEQAGWIRIAPICGQQAERARRWADWLTDKEDRELLEALARDYERRAEGTDDD
jgi:hypothetical protein